MFSTLLSAAALVATASAAFDPLSKNNVITYWGQGANQARLLETCKNSAYDIIAVGFVNVFPDQGEGGWPGTNFGNACWGDVYQNAKGVNTSLLKTCPNIGPDVIECQKTYGKKIFLSLGGGSKPDYYLKSAAAGRSFANFLWAAFGPKSASTADVPRPWGDAAVDGFDFDIESLITPAPAGQPNYQKAYYTDMIKRFKSDLFPTDTTKSYYISGAPQCVIPDAHFTDVVANSWFDYLFIQFYNTNGCSARDGIKVINGQQTSDISYLKWVAAKSLNPNVRMSIGLPAAKTASSLSTYYLTPTEVQKLVKKFYKQKLFGGIMLWEATFAVNNKVCSKDYGTWMKDILKGQAAGKDITTTCPAKRELSDYEEAPESTSTQCTSTVTITRSKSSSAPVTDVPSYGTTESSSSPVAPVTTSAPLSSASSSHGAWSSFANVSSASASGDLSTKTTTVLWGNSTQTSTYAEHSVSESAPAESYSGSPAESSPAASSPASPEQSSLAPSNPASEACGDVTVTETKKSTVYVTATQGAPSQSGDVTSWTTRQSTSTRYKTHTVYVTRSQSASASAVVSPSSPASPESSSPSDYENSPVGEAGSSSSAPATPASPSHGHHHGTGYSHSHGAEEGPQSTTTVVNVVTVIPVPVTSSGAVQPTEAPYPYGPIGGNGTAPGTASASASASAWPSYVAPVQTGTAGPLSIVGDPLGQVLEKGLSPLGHVTGKIGEPNGQAFLDLQKQMKEEVGYQDKTKVDDAGPGGESVGGKEQTAKNPLGL